MSDEPRVAPRRPEDHIDPETIAAWLDEPDDLNAEERAVLEAHLNDCAECQQVAADLRVLVAALAALPEAALPRSFALGPEHARRVTAPVARREPTPIQAASSWYDRQMRALRWATAAAAVLFVFVLGVDLATTRFDRSASDDSAAVTSMEQSSSAGADAPAEGDAANEDTMAAKAAPEATPTPATPGVTPAAAESAVTPAAAQGAAEAGATATDAAGATDQEAFDATREEAEPQSPSRREERLRLLEFGLATLFVWLLGLMIVLPRLRRRRGNRS